MPMMSESLLVIRPTSGFGSETGCHRGRRKSLGAPDIKTLMTCPIIAGPSRLHAPSDLNRIIRIAAAEDLNLA